MIDRADLNFESRFQRLQNGSVQFFFLWLIACFGAAPALGDLPGRFGGQRFVESPIGQFESLEHHPETLGFRNNESRGAIDASNANHYQGVIRYPGTGVPVFYLTQLETSTSGTTGGYLHIVRLPSRKTDGERLGSNVQSRRQDTEDTLPPFSDSWLRSIRFDGSLMADGAPIPSYKHPGGMAIVDDVLFVSMDQPLSGTAPAGQIVLFDLRGDPENPRPIASIPLNHSIDNLAVTRQSDGRILIWTNGDSANSITNYRSTGTDLRSSGLTFGPRMRWRPQSDLHGAGWPTGPGAHQSSTFFRRPDGVLMMIATRNEFGFLSGLPFVGRDYADLYRVSEGGPAGLALHHVRTKEFYCVFDGGGGARDMRVCHFGAAASAYVSPTGELILYAAPHDDEDSFSPNFTRMAEFRHTDGMRPGNPSFRAQAYIQTPPKVQEGSAIILQGFGAGASDRPWVTLYDDENFQDRSIVVDYDARHLLELDDFNRLDGFNDKTTAVRWRAPVGMTIMLYDDDGFSDRRIVLRGTGRTEEISNLDEQRVVPGLIEQQSPSKAAGQRLKFNDKTSSLRFFGSPPPVREPEFIWDLDEDGRYGERGTQFQQHEIGQRTTFSARWLDGPDLVDVTLRVGVPGSREIATASARIEILNEAPRIDLESIESEWGGSLVAGAPVVMSGWIYDIMGDQISTRIDWGDGTIQFVDVDLYSREFSAPHRYAKPGTFKISIRSVDDECEFDDLSTIREVHDPSDPLVRGAALKEPLVAEAGLQWKDREEDADLIDWPRMGSLPELQSVDTDRICPFVFLLP